jgi:ribosome-associated heat shock protein Hsp15
MDEEASAQRSLRIDKWLWHARFCKTRSIAQDLAAKGHVRLNGARVEKASATVRPGDILTLPAGREVLVVKVRELGARRGPASEARLLYEIVPESVAG